MPRNIYLFQAAQIVLVTPGDSHIKAAGVIVGNFERNPPKRYQNPCSFATSFPGSLFLPPKATACWQFCWCGSKRYQFGSSPTIASLKTNEELSNSFMKNTTTTKMRKKENTGRERKTQYSAYCDRQWGSRATLYREREIPTMQTVLQATQIYNKNNITNPFYFQTIFYYIFYILLNNFIHKSIYSSIYL